ncbi:hypothetical protein GGGNBK_12755 [Sporosarcina sp. ANT_H38]|uniref:hypothetical protein n=1 Tax=Sporosarcina sp. ANT_H38 TaxID=2597358 RepID=UPI00165E16FE|nr:hypothetical protein [Sporosarcina sp. ANT_H38]
MKFHYKEFVCSISVKLLASTINTMVAAITYMLALLTGFLFLHKDQLHKYLLNPSALFQIL